MSINSNYQSFSGTPKTANTNNKKHPVRNTLLGVGAGAVAGGAIGYAQKATDVDAISNMFFIGNQGKSKEAMFKELKENGSTVIEDAYKAVKQMKGLKYGAIGAAVVGVVALGATLLSGGKKADKAE